MRSAIVRGMVAVAFGVVVLALATTQLRAAEQTEETKSSIELAVPSAQDNAAAAKDQAKTSATISESAAKEKKEAPAAAAGDKTAVAQGPTPAKRQEVSAAPLAPPAGKKAEDKTADKPADKAAPTAKTPAADVAKEDALKPIPDAQSVAAQPVAVEASSFNGVVPGKSTPEDVRKAWGAPQNQTEQDGSLIQSYVVEPFKNVEVSYLSGKIAAIVIRFDHSYPAEAVAKQLELAQIRPVLVVGEMGETLGLSYPERGVLFAFEPGKEPNKPSMKVMQVILEPISAEPFLLRGETLLEQQPALAKRDIEQAIMRDRKNARAHWLYSRVAVMLDDYPKALKAVTEAVRLAPNDPHYHISRAQILGQLGQFPEALEEAKKATELAAEQPHRKARALCLQGDLLASGLNPDYRQALTFHTQAIQLADPLTRDPHPAIRVAAKEVLADGHLGAAHDIAWGDWKDKEKAVPRWIDRAVKVADDLVAREGASEEQRFRVHARTLAAYAGVRGNIDPSASAAAVVQAGEKLIAGTEDATRKAQYEWDLGISLYDALQIAQTQAHYDEAVKYGEAAVAHLEKANAGASAPTNTILLGRLYFRLGSIYATRNKDHKAAVAWFDKAAPLLERPLPEEAQPDVGRQGEMLVSMGVSYWETKQHEKAVNVTQKGIAMMEQGARLGSLERASLAIPYRNLAAMHRQQGDKDLADHFLEMAGRIKNERMR